MLVGFSIIATKTIQRRDCEEPNEPRHPGLMESTRVLVVVVSTASVYVVSAVVLLEITESVRQRYCRTLENFSHWKSEVEALDAMRPEPLW